MRRFRIVLPAALAVLAIAGVVIGVAVGAVSGPSTGTVSVCATASTPAHTVAVDASDVSTIPGATDQECATTTYTVPTVTETQTVTTTAAPAPNPNVLFDGSASKMNTLYSYEDTYGDKSTLHAAQDPAIWTCLCFMQNDISLASDPIFGKVYDVKVATGDANPSNFGSNPTYGAGQLSTRRTIDIGQWDYFSGAVKVNSWNGPISDLHFVDVWSLGYQTAEGDQVALRLWNGPQDAGPLQWDVQQNAGYVNSPTAYKAGTTNYETAFKNVTLGQWEEFVLAIKGSTHQDGEVVVYNRQPGGTWAKVFDKTGVDTAIYGTTTYGTFAQDPDPTTTVIDKIGLYFQEYGSESEAVQESGLIRSSDLATAESVLP